MRAKFSLLAAVDVDDNLGLDFMPRGLYVRSNGHQPFRSGDGKRRPNVIMVGEPLEKSFQMMAGDIVAECLHVMGLGSALQVSPASHFPAFALDSGEPWDDRADSSSTNPQDPL